MKKLMITLSAAAVLGLFPANTINAATQVYDLKADWSDTQNPNGTWSYRRGDSLLLNDPFPWSYTEPILGVVTAEITKTTEAFVVPGYLELGDISVTTSSLESVIVRWTAPASGTINISGILWGGSPVFFPSTYWTLYHNGVLSENLSYSGSRTLPDNLSSGSGGADALQNIAVAQGDLVELEISTGGEPTGLNFVISFTPDSIDPAAAIEQLAETVAAMNLQNGIENSLDAKLDAALGALDDLNANDDVAACNTLEAFINDVEAQRGNKLTDAQADQLIAAAQAIQASLDCGD
jgi:hypothetical protein